MGFSSDQPLVSNQLPVSTEFSHNVEEYEDFVEDLELLYKRVAASVNTKVGGLFVPYEVATFKQFPLRSTTAPFPYLPQQFTNVYRKTVDFGALPNTALKSVAHGITFTANSKATMIYAAATDPVNLLYIPIPFSSPTLNENIKISIDATNINITTAIDYSPFTMCNVVLEYSKN
jgi:hypothetical protein